jgi:Sec-independent protein translocase protein TatA
MFFGLTIEKLLLIGVIAALIVGPERMPRYAEGLAHLVTRLRDFLRGAKTRVRDEMGSDFDDVDWRKLDPRQYDPRGTADARRGCRRRGAAGPDRAAALRQRGDLSAGQVNESTVVPQASRSFRSRSASSRSVRSMTSVSRASIV